MRRGPSSAQGLHRIVVRRFARLALSVAVAAALPGVPAPAQDDPAGEASAFDRQSLALRTALHYDPSLEPPLDRLVEQYQGAGRIDELVTLYRTHIAQYPADAGAHAVLVRLLQRLRRPDASSMAALGRQRHPQSALIAYLQFQDYANQRDPRAVDALADAVSLEPNPGRRNQWLTELVEQAEVWGKPERARERLEAEAGRADLAPEQSLELARTMMGAGFAELALATLARVDRSLASPELGVEIELLAAEAEADLDQLEAATARLDGLLRKVAPDYWRRPEIVVRRVNLVGSDAAREEMLRVARERVAQAPDSEAAVLDLAELLEAADLRREAVDVVLDAAERLPASDRIERRAVELLDRTGDERRAVGFLEERLAAQPGRDDLAYRLVKALYAVGDARQARDVFVRLMERVPESARANQTLELARSVRRMAMFAEAAELFRECVDLLPDRLDVRRELAEVFIAAGDRAAARALFTAEITGQGEIENVLDAVQFLIGEGMLGEAEETLSRRLESEPTNFDLQILLVEVYGKLGERSTGMRWIDSSRELADTGARYARWLDTAIQFHELYDSVDGFFDREEARFTDSGDEWETDTLSRFLTFCEAARRSQRTEAISGVLRSRLEDPKLPEESKTELRRLLVDVLDRDPANQTEVQRELSRLTTDDAANAGVYRLRTARLYHDAGRPDLARPLLDEVDLNLVGDVKALSSAQALFLEYGLAERSIEALRRLTQLEPSTLSYWERWLQMLAVAGNEEEFRKAVRQVLAGVTRRELSRETYALLRGHAADSYWRSLVRAGVTDRHDEPLTAAEAADAFAMLEGVERLLAEDPSRLWVLWARAWLLGRDGRHDALVQVLDQLAREADLYKAESIVFPDGLSLDLAAAQSFLRDSGPGAGSPTDLSDLGDGAFRGPAGSAALRWMFRTDGGAEVTQVARLGADAFLVRDAQGMIYRIARDTGKLAWAVASPTAGTAGSGARPIVRRRVVVRGGGPSGVAPSPAQQNYSAPDFQLYSQAAVSDDGSLIFVASAVRLVALDGESGDVLWETGLGDLLPPSSAMASRGQQGFVPPSAVFVDRGAVVAHSPATGIAAGFNARSGKLLWSADVASESGEQPASMASGSAHGQRMLFAFGGRAEVLDTVTGRALWSLSRNNAREFPIRLEEAAAENDGSLVVSPSSPWSQLAGAGMGAVAPQYLSYLDSGSVQQYWTRQFIEGRGALVSPAVRWASFLEDGAGGFAAMAGRRLLLMGIDGVVSVSLDLPVGATHFRVSGVFVGAAGSKAVFLIDRGRKLAVCHLNSGKMDVLDCGKIFGDKGGDASDANAVVDSARCYVSGPNGVLGVSVHTGQELFFTPWPDEARERMPRNAEGLDGLPGDDSGSATAWQGTVRTRQGRPGACLPMRGAVADGVLVTAAAPGWVAAFGERAGAEAQTAPADARPPAPDR